MAVLDKILCVQEQIQMCACVQECGQGVQSVPLVAWPFSLERGSRKMAPFITKHYCIFLNALIKSCNDFIFFKIICQV